mmetsp:Transcript_8902/g.14833  ORF Transcript_8902/g.14833 Transcript_8902/m.14833 type:complete len:225 (+) Transcript_8902:139-813(+)
MHLPDMCILHLAARESIGARTGGIVYPGVTLRFKICGALCQASFVRLRRGAMQSSSIFQTAYHQSRINNPQTKPTNLLGDVTSTNQSKLVSRRATSWYNKSHQGRKRGQQRGVCGRILSLSNRKPPTSKIRSKPHPRDHQRTTEDSTFVNAFPHQQISELDRSRDADITVAAAGEAARDVTHDHQRQHLNHVGNRLHIVGRGDGTNANDFNYRCRLEEGLTQSD